MPVSGTSRSVTIIDYGRGNLLSVARALESCGAKVILAKDTDAIRSADRLLLPGVGAFGDALTALRRNDSDQAIYDFVQTGQPFFGICIGMQLMFDESDEFGKNLGLGLLQGRVTAIPRTTTDGVRHKVPHTGWNKLLPVDSGVQWKNSIFSNIKPESWVYFIHSFTATPANDNVRLADTYYGGCRISAAVVKDNMLGTQFHPEKSGEVGLAVIRNFLEA
jgi:imidazole glycerol-phosphate synthase subunit HisH